ncbi:trypsin zeta-like [Chironomus tepperi]|uniref:trypsin zeta-like n=1 Tax=Chironomus tepperi TaxID=113505 RepID=UPI00391F5E57
MNNLKILVVFLYLSIICAQRIPVLNNGNENKSIDHIPYVASLRLDETDESYFGKGHFCTGVFIGTKAVLTLASCFYRNDALLLPEDVRIIGGTKFKFEEEDMTFSTVLEDIKIHENFSRSSLENNIAIGYLLDVIPKDNAFVKTISRIAMETAAENQQMMIYGWSLSTMMYEESLHLLSGKVDIVSVEQCDTEHNKITSSTICAGPYFVNGCETDDGGPLVDDARGGTLYGLIDARPAGYCSRIITNRLGTYVDVSQFYNWILEYNRNSASCRSIISIIVLITLCIVLPKIIL